MTIIVRLRKCATLFSQENKKEILTKQVKERGPCMLINSSLEFPCPEEKEAFTQVNRQNSKK